MTTLEITLIIIGVVFLIGSFMVNDKLSHKDLDKIADMSAEELKIITEKEVTAAKKDLSDALDEEITQKQDETKRSLEKEANSKIMAINEYSDTVLDSINKAHNEIMFLYSMLNDKHDELTRLSGDIDKASSRLRSSFEPLSADSAKRAEKPSVAVQKPAEPKSGTMQQDTKPDMKQVTGIDISVFWEEASEFAAEESVFSLLYSSATVPEIFFASTIPSVLAFSIISVSDMDCLLS